MICKNCNKENREKAKFCKWCGFKLPVVTVNPLDKLIGMEDVKKQIHTIIDTFTSLKLHPATQNIRLSLNSIIIGETGTGKTLLPTILRDIFHSYGIIKTPLLKIVDAVDYDRFVENWDKNIEETKGGILFIDNAQKLLPDSYSKNVNPLDKLFIEMGKWENDPIVIIAGLPGGLEEFLKNNPAVRNRFKYLFRLPGYNYEELRDICIQYLKDNYGGLKISPEAYDRLTRQFKYEVKIKDSSFGYGHLARQKAEDIFTSYITHPIDDSGIIPPEDITCYVPPVRTLEDILAEMDEFIGMAEVKRAVREIALEIQNNLQREQRGLSSEAKPSLHIMLTGNPGTGKTTVARKLGEIFEAIGFLDSGHVIEADRSRMVSQYIGETPKLVDKLCDEAIGGILFIDEAYTLAPVDPSGKKDELGIQALEKLMKRMEDDRGKFVVIAAGYKTEMENLIRINPGMRSRFNRYLNIEDYTPDELFDILCGFINKGKYVLNSEAEKRVRKAIRQMYEARDKSFANGREMRTLFEKMCSSHSQRISRLALNERTDDVLITFEPADVPYDEPEIINKQECINKLKGLIGLRNVKEEIINLTGYLNMQLKRGDTSGILGKHYVFTGNPGTGKTTVARIMAEIFKSMGIISRGQLIEADRSSLVAGYAGQTSLKTNQLVDSALGGVLFIDEAYTLYSGDNDSFGKEAIDTLLKRMEDDRGKFICIAAGYTKEMHDFISVNPGLKSRFTETIRFEDYSPEELTQIFINLAVNKKFVLTEETKKGIKRHFETIYLSRDKSFGNAREVRKVFEQAVSNQSKRLMSLINTPEFDPGMMNELLIQDISGKEKAQLKTLDEIMAELDEFIGMTEVKQSIRALAQQAAFLKMRTEQGFGSTENLALHIVLTGNPGTGKTTIARKLGEIFQAIGLLPDNKVIEVDRSQMVSQYMGETPKIVNALCDRAMGGILFIDEAYTLSVSDETGSDKYGKEAIEALMKRMEDDKGKFIIIAAGYKDEMKKFLQMNLGLESRFTHYLHIEDYTVAELIQIFKSMVYKKQYILTPEADKVLSAKVLSIFMKKGKNFGNAREMRKLFDTVIQRLSARIARIPNNEMRSEYFQMIMPEDIDFEL